MRQKQESRAWTYSTRTRSVQLGLAQRRGRSDLLRTEMHTDAEGGKPAHGNYSAEKHLVPSVMGRVCVLLSTINGQVSCRHFAVRTLGSKQAGGPGVPLTLGYTEERGWGPSHNPHTGEGRRGSPHVHGPKSLYKVKIDGKTKWAPGGRGVKAREVGILLISGPDPSPGPGPGQCNSWYQEHLGAWPFSEDRTL